MIGPRPLRSNRTVCWIANFIFYDVHTIPIVPVIFQTRHASPGAPLPLHCFLCKMFFASHVYLYVFHVSIFTLAFSRQSLNIPVASFEQAFPFFEYNDPRNVGLSTHKLSSVYESVALRTFRRLHCGMRAMPRTANNSIQTCMLSSSPILHINPQIRKKSAGPEAKRTDKSDKYISYCEEFSAERDVSRKTQASPNYSSA